MPTKKVPSQSDPDLREEYDFQTGTRGKYAARYAERTNIVLLEPDVAAAFATADEVNKALRQLLARV